MTRRVAMTSPDISKKKEFKSTMYGCSNRRLRDQKRQRFGSRESTETEPNVPLSGHSIAGSWTGTTISPKRTIPAARGHWQSPTDSWATFITQFCFLFLFAATINDISVASFNLHGAKASSAYLKSCIANHGGIWLGQEHWLSEQQLPQLQQIGAQFVAQSGMETAISNRIYPGRPFGGVCIAWSPNINHIVTPLTAFRHKRVIAIEVKEKDNNILVLCAYMPFYDSSNRVRCMAETVDAISMLESIIDEYPDHEIILGGDLNTELKGDSPFDAHWDQFANKYKLISCDGFYPSNSFTYHHKTLNQKKFNDHFLVSESIANAGKMSQFVILDEGDNQSDHLPINLTLSSDFGHQSLDPNGSNAVESLKWGKLNDSHKKEYTERVDSFTRNTTNAVFNLPCSNKCHYDDAICKQCLQQEYCNLGKCMKDADSSLPRFKPGSEKDWWTNDLSRLKQQSVDIHSLWISEGRPRQGATHDERIRVRAIYKLAISAAQRAPRQKAWNKMHSSLCDKETGSFWRSWKSLYNKNKGGLAPVVDGCSSKATIADCFRKSFQQNSVPNNRSKVDQLNERFAAQYEEYEAKHNELCDCKSTYILPMNIIDALGSMRCNKSADESGITAEHFHYAPLSLLLRFVALFKKPDDPPFFCAKRIQGRFHDTNCERSSGEQSRYFQLPRNYNLAYRIKTI